MQLAVAMEFINFALVAGQHADDGLTQSAQGGNRFTQRSVLPQVSPPVKLMTTSTPPEAPPPEAPPAEAPPADPAPLPMDARKRGMTLAVVAGVAILGIAAMRLRGRPKPTANSAGVELRLHGTTPGARIRFTAPGGLVTENVRLPWGYQLPAIAGQAVSVHATAGGSTGELVCEILVRGQPWRTQTASGAGPTVACDGVIGSP